MIFDSRTRFRKKTGSGNHHADRQPLRHEPEFDFDTILRPVDQWIGRHPAISAGVAVAVGVAIGCFVKRR